MSTKHQPQLLPLCPSFLEVRVIMEKHLALIKAFSSLPPLSRHPPRGSLSLPLSFQHLCPSPNPFPNSLPPSDSSPLIHSPRPSRAGGLPLVLPPPVLHLLPPATISLSCSRLLCFVCTLHHDACGPRLGSLLVPVSEFRMDKGSADQLHQVRSHCEEIVSD